MNGILAARLVSRKDGFGSLASSLYKDKVMQTCGVGFNTLDPLILINQARNVLYPYVYLSAINTLSCRHHLQGLHIAASSIHLDTSMVFTATRFLFTICTEITE
jgi:hypothetical protein